VPRGSVGEGPKSTLENGEVNEEEIRGTGLIKVETDAGVTNSGVRRLQRNLGRKKVLLKGASGATSVRVYRDFPTRRIGHIFGVSCSRKREEGVVSRHLDGQKLSDEGNRCGLELGLKDQTLATLRPRERLDDLLSRSY